MSLFSCGVVNGLQILLNFPVLIIILPCAPADQLPGRKQIIFIGWYEVNFYRKYVLTDHVFKDYIYITY